MALGGWVRGGWVYVCVYIYVCIYMNCDVGVGVDKRLCIVRELITCCRWCLQNVFVYVVYMYVYTHIHMCIHICIYIYM